jgi:acetyl-CoA carboxylase, biotin carboxylase subunit
VTEMVTGLDLVKEQVRIAAGFPLGIRQEDVEIRGWSLECRIYAEDPANHFLPSPGRIVAVRLPAGPRVRVDAAVFGGSEVSLHYDPMVAKVVTWGRDRAEAASVMLRALKEFQIVGIHTNKDFLERIVAHPEFLAGRLDTGFIPRFFDEEGLQPPGPCAVADIAAAIFAYETGRRHEAPCTGRQEPSRWRAATRNG